jgi:tRNA-dependent cyclodipeptide synthase
VGGRLRLRVKRQTLWSNIPITERHASVEISTSNKYCTGDYLVAQLEWARDQFADFQFAIGDTLQIHNYVVLGHPRLGWLEEDVAHKECVIEGDEWITANEPAIRWVLGVRPFWFARWDDLLAKPQVQANLAALNHLDETDAMLHDLVRQDVTGYVARRHGAVELTDEQWRRLDRHVLEELAVYQYQAAPGQDLVSIYPGSNQLPLRPKYLNETRLPEELKRRHYVTLDIQPAHTSDVIDTGDLVGVGV